MKWSQKQHVMLEKTFKAKYFFSDSVIPESSGYIYLPSVVTDIFYFSSYQAIL